MPQQEPEWLVQRPFGPDLMKASRYYRVFGSTRVERAKRMETLNLLLRKVPGQPDVFTAPSQPMLMHDVYTVCKHLGKSCSCTCPDFLRHAVYDDMFACKHMLLPHEQQPPAP